MRRARRSEPVSVVRLVPAGMPVCRGKDLAKALAAAELSDREALAWSRDLKAARKKLKPPRNRWQ